MTATLSRRRLLVAAVIAAGLQTGVLASMIASNARILSEGVEIRLATVPVDPRDLLRGHYVTLTYAFTALDSSLIAGSWPTKIGMQRLSVRLSPDADGFWHPVAASFGDLPAEEGSVVIRSLPFQFNPLSENPPILRVDYGIERYYVSEGQGKALEEARDNRRIAVRVRVAADGSVRIAGLDEIGTPAGG